MGLSQAKIGRRMVHLQVLCFQLFTGFIVIPDYAKLTYVARAPTRGELKVFVDKVTNCLK